MKSRLLALAFLVTGAAGCVDDRAYLEIYGICSMPDTCTFGATCDTYAMGPVAYATGGSDLYLALELRNQLADNADEGTGRVNSNDAHVTGGKAEFEVGGSVVGTVRFSTGNSVIPAGGSSLVWAAPATSAVPEGNYTVQLYLSGYYDNGNDFVVGPFPFGLEVYASGTVFCPAGTVDACPGTGDQFPAACVTP